MTTTFEKTFVQQVFDLLAMTECRVAETVAEQEAIYALRYRGYLRAGSIEPNEEERFTDSFDSEPNTFSVALYIHGALAASIRLSIASRAFPHIPSTHPFPEFIMPMIEAGQVVIDPTRNVVSLEGARRYPKLPYLTARMGWIAGEFFDADVILAAVRTEHQAFFRRSFGHRLICEARPYPTLQKPIALMALDFPEAREKVLQRYPFYGSTPTERWALFGSLRGLREQTRQGRAAVAC